MMREDRKPEADSSLGPLLVFGIGLVFTGVMLFFLVSDLWFVFAGVPVQAKIARKWHENGDGQPSFELVFSSDRREYVLRDEPRNAGDRAE